MSRLPEARTVSISSAGYQDGLGRRSVRFDREIGGMLECLHLRPELWAFEATLRARADMIGALDDERFVRVRSIERANHGVVVVSELVPGQRLIDIIEARRNDDSAVFGIEAALGFLLQALPALSALHAVSIAHGVVAPGRIIVTPSSQLVLLDGIYGEALQRVNLNRQVLWSSLGILTPQTLAAAHFDPQSDASQAVLCALFVALGRQADGASDPSWLAPLVCEATELAEIRAGGDFAAGVRQLFTSALPLGGPRPGVGIDDLTAEVGRLAGLIGEGASHAAFADLTRVDASTATMPAALGDGVLTVEKPVPLTLIAASRKRERDTPQAKQGVATRPSRPAAIPPAPAVATPIVDRTAGVPRPSDSVPFHSGGSRAPQPIAEPAASVAAVPKPSLSGGAGVVSSAAPTAMLPSGTPAQPPLVVAAPAVAVAVPPPPQFVPGPPAARRSVTSAEPTTASVTVPPVVRPSAPITIAATQPTLVRVKPEPRPVSTPPPSEAWSARAFPSFERMRDSEPSRYSWKSVAAAVLAVSVMGIAGRTFLQGRSEPRAVVASPVPVPVEETVPVRTTGSIVIDSQPSGAKVALDGADVGVTPLKLEAVEAGKHTIAITTAGATVRRTVRIEAGKSVTVDVPIYSGWVAVFSPIPLDISSGGRTLGNTDTGKIMLPPGRHILTLSNREFGFTDTRTVEIHPGEERPLNMEPKGRVNVNAHPWAEVWVDGRKAGDTPIANLPVLLGTRVFVFKHPQYGDRRVTTTITTTGAALSVDFTKPGTL